MKTWLAWGIILMCCVTGSAKPGFAAKREATYYTPERIAVGRENVARYAWAKSLLTRIQQGDSIHYYIGHDYASADAYGAQSDDFMWELQPPSSIPRVYPFETKAICPIHGREVQKISAYCPWLIDPINHPYQVQCALGKEWYPSNDYAKGDMTSGAFPDDGNGFQQGDTRYYFIREYAFYVYNAITIPLLRSLSQAYVLTGDKKYARKGAIMLARLASEYPNFAERKDRLFYATTGGYDPHYTYKTGGMMTDLIWETFCLEATAYAYDAFYPYLSEDPELLSFLRAKGMPVQTGDDLRHYIEEKILRVGMQAILNGHIHGNEGHHQAAAMACALVMDDFGDVHPNSKDMIDYVYFGGGHSAYMMVNALQRDGGGHESLGYNRIKLDFIRTNRMMEELRRRHPDLLPEAQYPDLFKGPKAHAIFDAYIDVMPLDYFMPSIGDSGGIRKPERQPPYQYSYLTFENLFAFQRYGDPRYARALTKPDGTLFAGELFEPYPEAKIRAALQLPASKIERASRLLDGTGIAILESGSHPNGRAAMLNYSSIIGHRQLDDLSLEFYSRGVDQLPDLGYPAGWDYASRWDVNSLAHNTVTVDETQPDYNIGGMARLFGSVDGVHLVTAQHDPYPVGYRPDDKAAKNVDLYERTVVLIDIDAEHSYLVDLFAVRGGEQHDQSWHGPLVPMQLPNLEWSKQEGGTLAGKEVAQFAKFTDRWGRQRDDFPAFLTHIRRATLREPAVVQWNLGLPEGDELDLHLIPLNGALELIAGGGRSPAREPSWNLDYLFARRQAKAGETSRFLAVIDAYQKAPNVRKVRVVAEKPLVLEVERTGGTDTIHLNVPESAGRGTAPRALGVQVVSHVDGKVVRDVRIGETDAAKSGYVRGTIGALDYETRQIAMDVDAKEDRYFLPGRALRIYNDKRSVMFRIVATRREGRRLWITLDLTALLAQGPVEETADSRLTLDAYLLFGRGSLDEKLQIKPGLNYFAGSWLGEGPTARPVKGVIANEKSLLFLEQAVPAAQLDKEWKGKVVSIWQYGIGDRIELARVVDNLHTKADNLHAKTDNHHTK